MIDRDFLIFFIYLLICLWYSGIDKLDDRVDDANMCAYVLFNKGIMEETSS